MDSNIETMPTIQPEVVSGIATAVSTPISMGDIKQCLVLLEEGKLKVPTNQTDIVFLLGMTGSGKTTLVKFLASNNEDLYSEEVAQSLGEYIIIDKEHKISSDTLLSQTIFPELYKDPETQIAFVDGPGFSDTRGLSVDLAGAYFVHKMISEAKKIRFLLTVNYSSVRHGMDRGDFLDLLKNVLHLVKNVDNYLDSMALVITKVENQFMKKDGELVPVPDEDAIEYVAKFLVDFKKNIPKVVNGAMAEDMNKIVNILLHKKDAMYEKIALFRRPDEAGPLSKIHMLQDGKISIKKIIQNNMKPALVNEKDFGYALSEESKNKLYDVITKINENIANVIEEVCKQKMLIYEAKYAQSTDVYELHDTLRKDFEKLRNWLAEKNVELTLSEFVDDLFAITQSTIVPFTEMEKNHILDQGEYIPFLEKINDKKFSGSMVVWKAGLQAYLNYMKESTNWFKFLTSLHRVLSSYPVQKNVKNFSNLVKHRVTDLHDEDFVPLLRFCKTLTSDLDESQSLIIDSLKAEQLNKILAVTLIPETSTTYDKDTKTLEIRGKFVKLSDVVRNTNMMEAKFVHIYSTDKLFIDTDFKRVNDNLQTLILIAPIWEIIGEIHINLDGEKGCCKPRFRADDGDFWMNGRNGKPGAPGKSAANFLGLVDNIINGENLRITAVGGEGSPGQDGGNGRAGRNGKSPIVETPWGCSGQNINQFSNQQIGGFFRRVYCVYGESGTNGGNGGDGGIGGYGGLAGKVNILPAKESSKIKIEAKNGSTGAPGLGGEGGLGGTAGRSWNHQKMVWWWKDASCSNSKRLANEYGDCASTDYLRHGEPGWRGQQGTNSDGAQLPESTSFINSGTIVSRYQGFLQDAINSDTVSRPSKIKFLHKIEEFAESKTRNINRLITRRDKRMVKIPVKRVKRYGPLDRAMPKWINSDCFNAPQWPVTEKIAHMESPSTLEISLTSIPIPEVLLLTNLLVRKLNQTRPNFFQSCAVDYTEARVCALQILKTFENILAKTGHDKEKEKDLDIDVTEMMEKLEYELVNGSPQNISKMLLAYVDNQFPERGEELRRQLSNGTILDSMGFNV